MTAKTCPLTGGAGTLLRRRHHDELIASYFSYLGKSPPLALLRKYLTEPIEEYYCSSSGVRWYSPMTLGEADYYSALAETYSWYYNSDSWDKKLALKLLDALRPGNVLEVGCGDGAFLELLQRRGIRAAGVDLNQKAVMRANSRGLTAATPDQANIIAANVDALCLLQTIEHSPDPSAMLRWYITKHQPTHILLSAPCFDGLLGRTRDPLSWPPHHATAWSCKGMHTLGALLGYKVAEVYYSPLCYREFEQCLKMEGSRRLFGLPTMPKGVVGEHVFRICSLLGLHWALRGHSILVRLEKRSPV